MHDESHYHSFSKLLHWTIAGLIVLQFILANLAEGADEAGQALRQLALLANHKSVGITVLLLAIVRLAWRIRTPPPPLPEKVDQWQKRASHVAHWTLYSLIIVMPLSGWLMSSASAYSVSWFNLVQLPDFVAPNPELKEVFEKTHELLARILFLVALVHILAALKHHFIDHDGILVRMSSPLYTALFAAIIVIGGWSLGATGTGAVAPEGVVTEPTVATVETVATESALPIWQIDFETSFIRFTGDQAGAEFDGVWQNWKADIRFDADDLDASSFDVTVYTTGVETDDDDRDTTLADPEWFDIKNHPEAYYRATDFSQADDGSFVANGRLTIKGLTSPVALTFTVEHDGQQRVLTGSADMLRLDLGVGLGEWVDTDWVGNEVRVDVRVDAIASPD